MRKPYVFPCCSSVGYNRHCCTQDSCVVHSANMSINICATMDKCSARSVCSTHAEGKYIFLSLSHQPQSAIAATTIRWENNQRAHARASHGDIHRHTQSHTSLSCVSLLICNYSGCMHFAHCELNSVYIQKQNESKQLDIAMLWYIFFLFLWARVACKCWVRASTRNWSPNSVCLFQIVRRFS